MPHELTKAQKKIAREIIEKGLHVEFEEGLARADRLLQQWRSGKLDNREAWHKLYGIVKDHDKHIAFRYDHITGSKYLLVIAGQLADKVVTQEDLSRFDEDTRQIIIHISGINA